MKLFKKNSIATILVVFFALFALGFIGPTAALAAATAPSLGAAASFSVLGAAAMSTANPTTISGDLGLSPGLAVSKTGTWTHTGGADYFGVGSLSATAQTAALGAFNNLVGQIPNGLWASATPTPGVWTIAVDQTFAGTLTLNGSYDDVWVFQIGRDLTFTGSVVLAGNAQACHVFWQVGRDVTIGSGSNFVGTLIAQNDITSASGAAINGRLISLTGTTIAMNGAASSISGPTCAASPVVPPPGSSGVRYGTINVVKTVINDSGGTKTVADFPLFVNGTPVISGQTNNFVAPAATYAITETSDPGYTQTFSGDCNATGHLDLRVNDRMFCIITNNDIGVPPVVPPVPPLIDVVKVPSPLALPGGPGPVTYTYTLRNVGTVPVTDVTMVGDSCVPIVFDSGDTNNDGKLDVNETWVYKCSTTLSETHTNTVVATGWANGISAVDIANATVVVGKPVVPPLIHITKVPNPLKLAAGGGWVTYTKKVTNPGTVALSNVRVTDDKCSPIKYISGDTNHNSKLDTSETWTYTCRTKLTKTTVNTAVATGQANGLTARDFAIATVVVAPAVPKLPNTGVDPNGNNIPWNIVIPSGIFVISSLLFVMRKKQTV